MSFPFSPQEICQQLAPYYHTQIIPGETLLFFDEVQSCQLALAKLRYFYEKYAELHVVAAGSLLEFSLDPSSAAADNISIP